MPPNKENPNLRGNCWIKDIVDPRKIKFFHCPHAMNYFEGFYSVDANSKPAVGATPFPIVTERIVINHYHTKSYEEFLIKVNRGRPETINNWLVKETFELQDRNEEFDDGILKYRAARAKNFSLESFDQKFSRMAEALIETLSEAGLSLETALTCRALSNYLLKKFPNDAVYWKICEENSLNAILNSLNKISFADARLLIRELPNLLSLPYPAVKDLRVAALNIISQLMNTMRLNSMWKDYAELDYIQDLLKLGG